MSIIDIYAAFEDQIRTLGGLQVYENRTPSTMPTAQNSYLRENMLNTDGSSPTLSGTGYEIEDGIYQVSVCVPKGEGKWNALTTAQTVKNLFPRGVSLVENNTTINIRRVVINGAGYDDGTHFVVPVSVYWRVVS